MLSIFNYLVYFDSIVKVDFLLGNNVCWWWWTFASLDQITCASQNANDLSGETTHEWAKEVAKMWQFWWNLELAMGIPISKTYKSWYVSSISLWYSLNDGLFKLTLCFILFQVSTSGRAGFFGVCDSYSGKKIHFIYKILYF